MPPAAPGQPLPTDAGVRRRSSFEQLGVTPPNEPVNTNGDTAIAIAAEEDLERLINSNEHRRDEVEEDEKQKQTRAEFSFFRMILLTISLLGMQFTYAPRAVTAPFVKYPSITIGAAGTVELGYGTPYLRSLGLPNSLTALVWLAGPLSGLLIQPIVGVYSDRCTLKLGRRRPFMIGGGILVITSILLIAYCKELSHVFHGTTDDKNPAVINTTITIAVLAFYFLDFSINAVQASCRSLIVDAVPLSQQETANAWGGRMIGIGSIVGYLTGGLNLPSLFPLLGNTQFKVLCSLAIVWFSVCVGATCLSVREVPYVQEEGRRGERGEGGRKWWSPLVDIWKAVRSLPEELQSICNVQFWSWLGWFPFLFYSTTWVAERATHGHIPSNDDDDLAGTRAGSLALLYNAIVGVVTTFVLPLITIRNHEEGQQEGWKKWLGLPRVWALSIWLFSALMLGTGVVSGVVGATVVIALSGISWGTTQWVPFTLIGEYISHTSTLDDSSPSHDQDEDATAHTLPSPSGYFQLDAEDDDDIASQPLNRDSFDRPSTDSTTPPPPVISKAARGDRNEGRRGVKLDAGMVLGIHNIYIVLPQFISTFVSSLVFAFLNWLAGRNSVPNGEGGGGGGAGGGEVDVYDEVGWVLRLGGVASLVAGFIALRVKEVRGAGRAGKVAVFVGGH
ncbi:hypothetical protein HDV00_007705 [Rhizophlyctis rosea]|nr:hypothetical protein HDV00_007705 [Rhizophlyctis rosea]